MSLFDLTAVQLGAAIRAGELTAEEAARQVMLSRLHIL